jgi:hypothetical protein
MKGLVAVWETHLNRYVTAPTYPHPYFGNKILIFMSLQAGLRCKIVKTKELRLKSSRIRSYGVSPGV